jgi:hypothetical protein
MKTTARLVAGLFATVILSGVVSTSVPTPAAADSHRQKARDDIRHARQDAQQARKLRREGKYDQARQYWQAAQKRRRMAERERERAHR